MNVVYELQQKITCALFYKVDKKKNNDHSVAYSRLRKLVYSRGGGGNRAPLEGL